MSKNSHQLPSVVPRIAMQNSIPLTERFDATTTAIAAAVEGEAAKKSTKTEKGGKKN